MPIKKLLKSKEPPKHVRTEPDEPVQGHGGHDESNWLVSYADMMTLLCGFFVMLFSLAKMDEGKYEKVREAVAQQFGQEFKPQSQELATFVNQILEESGVAKEATVKMDPLGVSIVFQSTLFFDTLSAEVKPQGREVLNKLIGGITARQQTGQKKYKIVVEGHTDSRPVLSGVFPTNWELSGARASHVVRMFLERGFTPDHLVAIGYADTRPAVPARTPAGTLDDSALAKNRRVVLRILEPRVDSIPFPEKMAETAATSPDPANSAH